MNKFTVFANCQSAALAKTLLESKTFSQHYKWLPVPPVHNLDGVDVAKVIDVVKQVDLFLYQPVATKEHRLETATSAFMLSQLKDSAQALSFPSIYFDGYFPHLGTLDGHQSVLNQVHDYFISYCYVKGVRALDCVELLQSDELYDKKTSRNLLKASLESLKWRERVNRIDLKVSGYIDQNYQVKKLFYQFNHPSSDLFVYIRDAILNKVGIADEAEIPPERYKKNYLSGINAPIYQSTYNHLGLQFKQSSTKYVVKNNAIELEDMVGQFYGFYQSLNKDKLANTILCNKPFVAKRIDKLL